MPTRKLNSFSMTLGVTILLLTGCDHRSTDKPETTSPDNGAVDHRAGPLVVEVTGSDYQWQLRYPGADGRLGTPDDIHAVRHPHVPVHTETQFRLSSRDYLYQFEIPRLNLNEIAVPDLEFALEFVVEETGELEFRGGQFCGYSHPELSGTLFVESRKTSKHGSRQCSGTKNSALCPIFHFCPDSRSQALLGNQSPAWLVCHNQKSFPSLTTKFVQENKKSIVSSIRHLTKD